MNHYKLIDVVDEINEREKDPANSGYDCFVGLEHYVSGEVVIRDYGSTEKLESTMKVFKKGDILVARRNVYLKRASMVDFNGLTSGDSIVLRAKDPLIGKILPFILNTDAFWDYADQYADGTMSKRLSPKTLMQYEFDLPDKEDLAELVDILWAADATKESYRRLIEETDELVKSQFIEMFGSTSDYEKVKLNRAFNLQMGKTPARDEKRLWESQDYKWISIADMSNYEKFTGETKEYISKTAVAETGIKPVPKGTVIMSFKLTIGRTAITSEDIYTNEAIMAFIPHEVIFDNNYLRYALHYFDWTEDLQNAVKGVTLNKNIIGQTEFSVPPIADQKSFAMFAEQSDKSKFELKKSIENINELMKSLMQQDFSN